jgi:hypothetical protein
MAASHAPTMATNPSCHESDSGIADQPGSQFAARTLTSMSGRADVVTRQQATPRGSFPLAHSVLRFSAVFLTLASGLIMTSFGCVLPLAPTFDDPPAEKNYAPELTQSDPAQGIVAGSAANLSISATDPNVGDPLVVRWIAEYPPYNQDRTRLLKNQTFPASLDGRPLQVTSRQDLDCLSLAQGALHPVTALVSDRDFLTVNDQPDLSIEEQFTKLRKNALSVEAHWVLNMQCGQ